MNCPKNAQACKQTDIEDYTYQSHRALSQIETPNRALTSETRLGRFLIGQYTRVNVVHNSVLTNEITRFLRSLTSKLYGTSKYNLRLLTRLRVFMIHFKNTTLVIPNTLAFEGMCMSDFYEDLEAIRVHQIASGCLQNVFPIKSSKKISRFFDFFLSIFFRIKSKNIVCLDLPTKTSKYRLDVSQLYVQCFTGFRLSQLSKNRSRCFFEILLIFFRKIIFSSLHRNLGKNLAVF